MTGPRVTPDPRHLQSGCNRPAGRRSGAFGEPYYAGRIRIGGERPPELLAPRPQPAAEAARTRAIRAVLLLPVRADDFGRKPMAPGVGDCGGTRTRATLDIRRNV